MGDYNFGTPVKNQAEKLQIITFKVCERRLQELWSLFQTGPVEPILIKGWAAARNYPQPYLRRLGDFDLAVEPALLKTARELTSNQKMGDIDWHRGLRRLDTVEWNDLSANSIMVECGDSQIRILRPEDHLRILCVHWLGDGGRDREKLWDIYHAVANRPANFDWDRCLLTVSEKRRRWISCAVGLAAKYLGLNVEKTPLADSVNRLPPWVIKTVEEEWNSPVEYRYLLSCLRDRRELFKQLKKRFPPNAIQATVETDGEFDEGARIFYQIRNAAGRTIPSLKRILGFGTADT